jgi:hypothetical protein
MTIHVSFAEFLAFLAFATVCLFFMIRVPVEYVRKFAYATHSSKHAAWKQTNNFYEIYEAGDCWVEEMPRERDWAEITTQSPRLALR